MLPIRMQGGPQLFLLPSPCFHQILRGYYLVSKVPLISEIFMSLLWFLLCLFCLQTGKKNSIPISVLGSQAPKLNRRSYHLLAKEVVQQAINSVGWGIKQMQ